MGKVNRKFYGLSQYKGPYCYELAGKGFRLVMDNGADYALSFFLVESEPLSLYSCCVQNGLIIRARYMQGRIQHGSANDSIA